MALNDALDYINSTYIFRTFYLETAEYTFFSSTNGTFSRIDHIQIEVCISPQNKLQQIQEGQSHTMHLLWPQSYESRSQSQEKIWKEYKYMEVKSHATKQWINQPGNQRRNKNVHGSKWEWKHHIPKPRM